MAKHTQFGKKGEKLAMELLKEKGCRIIAVNWRYQRFEIDIIAETDNEIIFVEVKSRATSFFGNPEEFISRGQQKRIIEAAHQYIEQNNIEKEGRFDVISVLKENGRMKLEHIDDAFSAFD
ncbi:MAG: YraN family protein [Flavobacteriales bacterium]|nr:YraN family protein [Flavobacteriales bacterium]